MHRRSKSLMGFAVGRRSLFRLMLSGALVASGIAACDSPRLSGSDGGVACIASRTFFYPSNQKLDVVFTIDDSPAMQPLQGKLMAQLPDFIHVLQNLCGGRRDLHIGVVSSSMGAGRYTNVPGCLPGSAGNNAGKFMHADSCTALAPGQSFLIANRDITNFTGDLADVFTCMATLGSNGCGFSQPFAATQLALEKAANPLDPDNGGFLRPDAYLVIVLVTNQDDCSVPANSDLFDPAQTSLADPYGGLQSYRCSEFGHTCNGGNPPHDPPIGVDTQTLDNCASAEDGVLLSRVSEFVAFLKGLKANPDTVLVSALAGPATPYAIGRQNFVTASGVPEPQPLLEPSCVGMGGDRGTPSVRVMNWLAAFGGNGVFEPICAANFAPVLTNIATCIAEEPFTCISGIVETGGDGAPACQVVEKIFGDSGTFVEHAIPLCDVRQANFPCWKLSGDRFFCPSGQRFQVCHDPSCSVLSPDQDTVAVTCALVPPC